MWDERYSAQDYVFGREPNDFLREEADRIPAGSRVLSLGEGEGRNAVFLARRGCEVTAVDSSRVGLRKARVLARAAGAGITTAWVDLERYAIRAGSWDAIISIFCHLPPALRARVHEQVAGGLRPGGVFVLEAYAPRQLEFGTGGPPLRELLMELEAVKDELAGLRCEVAREVVRPVVEGTGHTGAAAVIQVLAVKPAEA
jgi:SAM-dependent methyltransferase